MILTRNLAFCLLFVSAARSDSLTLHWNELSAAITQHNISLDLPDGAKLRGVAIGIEGEALVLDIRKNSSPGRHPLGRQSIPRDQVRTLRINRNTTRWRIVGTLVGAAVGIPAGALVAFERNGVLGGKSNGGTPAAIAIIGGLTAGGYLIGWAADRHTTKVVVTAD